MFTGRGFDGLQCQDVNTIYGFTDLPPSLPLCRRTARHAPVNQNVAGRRKSGANRWFGGENLDLAGPRGAKICAASGRAGSENLELRGLVQL